MNRKHNAGFSLVEVLIAIAVLGIIMIPTSTALVTFHRLNARTEEMFHEQLAVASKVEEMMATGITEEIPEDVEGIKQTEDNVTIEIVKVKNGEEVEPYFKVTVTSGDSEEENMKAVSVTTYIRKAPTEPTGEEEQP